MAKFTKEDYKKKVEALFNRFPSVQKEDFGKAYKPGLENILNFELLLGNPHKSFRSVHVAGTNGKGSVASMLASALSAVGLKTGLYTSPHIEDFRERMRIEGKMIDEEYVYDFLCNYEADMDALDLSFFEITTGMAFKWFADSKVDVAVIEVGLGGRLDSTNIITPDLSIVTSIALDHCALLGNTLEAIAGEKAGIFKKGVPALVGEALKETRPVFEAKARDFCPLHFAEDSDPSLWPDSGRVLMNMDLRGEYQRKNLRTALSAVDILKNMLPYTGLSDSAAVEDAIVHTAERTDFHGRWERLSADPLIIADIGHNPAALKENFAQLEEMRQKGDYSSLILVYGVMADKDLDGIMPLMPLDATFVFTSPAIRRALPVDDLVSRFLDFRNRSGCPAERMFSAPVVKEAIEMAIDLAAKSSADAIGNGGRQASPLIFIGGSAYLVSEAAEALGNLQGFE